MPRKTKSRLNRATRDRVLARLLEADLGPRELARELEVSVESLAQCGLDADLVRTLEGLAKLADIRAQLLVANFRANAAIQLIQIAAASQPTELSRKACVNLLDADLDVFDDTRSLEPNEPDESTAPPASTVKRILQAMQQLGEADEQAVLAMQQDPAWHAAQPPHEQVDDDQMLNDQADDDQAHVGDQAHADDQLHNSTRHNPSPHQLRVPSRDAAAAATATASAAIASPSQPHPAAQR